MADRLHIHALPPGYRLHWYQVKSVLGQGGFGITYLAEDLNLGQDVAIKEFLPSELAARTEDSSVQPLSGDHNDTYTWGLSRFITEARTLGRFKHPNIVKVHSVFEGNNTAYMVMEQVHGDSMGVALKSGRLRGEAALKSMLLQLMGGVEQVHAAGFIHRDIKPSNIFVRPDGTPVLIDFGSARQALGHQTQALTALVSPGYAPYEQYGSSQDEDDKQGPWTDIYALGATFYRAISGRGPVDAMARVKAFVDGKDVLIPATELGKAYYSKRFLEAIDKALAFRPQDRPQSVAQWREMITGKSASDKDRDAIRETREISQSMPSVDKLRSTLGGSSKDNANTGSATQTGHRAGGGASVASQSDARTAARPQSVATSKPTSARASPPRPTLALSDGLDVKTGVDRPDVLAEAWREPKPVPLEADEPLGAGVSLSKKNKLGGIVGGVLFIVPILLMFAQLVGVILGLCLLGGGAMLVVRACRPDFGMIKAGLAWIGGVLTVFAFLGFGYSFLASVFSVLFAFGFLYASFSEDFLDL